MLGVGGAAIANEGGLKKALTSRLTRFSRPSRVWRVKLVLQYIGFSILYRPGLYWFVKGLFNRLSRMGLAVGNYNPIDPGVPYSVMEMVRNFSVASSKEIPVEFTDRRKGDLPIFYADASKANERLSWRAELGLDAICRSTWTWQSRNPDGYR